MDDAPSIPLPAQQAIERAHAAAADLRRAHADLYGCLRELEELDVAGALGHRALDRLVEEHLLLDAKHAARLLREGHALAPGRTPTGQPTPAALPATAEAMDQAAISADHVTVIARTMKRVDRLPAVDPATRAITEGQLAGLARHRCPQALTGAAAEILALLDPDGDVPDDADLPHAELHVTRRKDGALHGKFRFLDPVTAEIIATALDAATPPPDQPGEMPTADPDAPAPPRAEHRTLAERRAQGLADIAAEVLTRHPHRHDHHESAESAESADGDVGAGAHGVGAGLDLRDRRAGDFVGGSDPDDPTLDPLRRYTPWPTNLPRLTRDDIPVPDTPREPGMTDGAPPWQRPETEGGERIHLAVTIDWNTLTRGLPGNPVPSGCPKAPPGRMGSAIKITPEVARRLACDADVIPAVLGTRSQVLDIGRRARVVPAALRSALVLRDRCCSQPGCRRRARRAAAHHIRHWADGGETSLDNLILLCNYHHVLIHHGGWRVAMIDGLPWFVPPPWLDPDRTPRHNRPWDTSAPPPDLAERIAAELAAQDAPLPDPGREINDVQEGDVYLGGVRAVADGAVAGGAEVVDAEHVRARLVRIWSGTGVTRSAASGLRTVRPGVWSVQRDG